MSYASAVLAGAFQNPVYSSVQATSINTLSETCGTLTLLNPVKTLYSSPLTNPSAGDIGFSQSFYGIDGNTDNLTLVSFSLPVGIYMCTLYADVENTNAAVGDSAAFQLYDPQYQKFLATTVQATTNGPNYGNMTGCLVCTNSSSVYTMSVLLTPSRPNISYRNVVVRCVQIG